MLNGPGNSRCLVRAGPETSLWLATRSPSSGKPHSTLEAPVRPVPLRPKPPEMLGASATAPEALPLRRAVPGGGCEQKSKSRRATKQASPILQFPAEIRVQWPRMNVRPIQRACLFGMHPEGSWGKLKVLCHNFGCPPSDAENVPTAIQIQSFAWLVKGRVRAAKGWA